MVAIIKDMKKLSAEEIADTFKVVASKIEKGEMKFFVVFFGKTCYIKNNGFIMLSQRWTICDVVFGSLNLKMYLKNDFSYRFWNRADATDRI